MLIGALFSALNGAVAKVLADDLSALEMVFYRNLIGVAIILYALKHTAPKLSGGKFHLLFVRGLFGFLAMIMFFYTITVIPLGEAITLNKTSPLFVTVLAYYLLKDRLSINTIFALLIGFFGDSRTLALHMASTIYRDFDDEVKGFLGITDGLVRISIGLESPQDIIDDFLEAVK